MVEFGTVLLRAALPALANFAGGLIAELRPVSDRALSFALHGAAGIVIARWKSHWHGRRIVAAATLRSAGMPRPRRVIAGAGFAVPILAGAALGYLALRAAPHLLILSVLAFTGGALLSVVVEEVVLQAHDANESRWDSLFLVGGFALFAAVSHYLPS
jgi:hypothetical protein